MKKYLKAICHLIVSSCMAMVLVSTAHAQAEGSLGSRTLKSYWIEGSSFLLITPTVPFDNPTGCTKSDSAVIPFNHPAYKPVLAAVIHAVSTGSPITLYAKGCITSWGETWPSFYAFGVSRN